MDKKFKIEFKDGKFVILADLNQDGQPLLSLSLDLAELLDEIGYVISKKDVA